MPAFLTCRALAPTFGPIKDNRITGARNLDREARDMQSSLLTRRDIKPPGQAANEAAQSRNADTMVLSTQDLLLHSGALLQEEIGYHNRQGDFEQVKVGGVASLGSATLDASIASGFDPTVGQQFMIIQNDGTDQILGTFACLAQGGTIGICGFRRTQTSRC
jgi:hypothetical protein